MAVEENVRTAIVLSGGGARGAYEAGVLSYLFEKIYPKLPPGFEFDIISGTSVGAIHAAYLAATAHLDGPARAERLIATWESMSARNVFRVTVGDLVGVPLRALGLSRMARPQGRRKAPEVVGGLVDVSPLERVVNERIPWKHLRDNLSGQRPTTLCVSCTEVRRGFVTVFMDGALANPTPWEYDANAVAVRASITPRHVRASAAIPFLFPAVRIGDRYFVDGGVRMNTPLSPALRLGSSRVVVVGLKHPATSKEEHPVYPEEVITQPAFLLGKVLNALMLDQLEYELQRLELVNALIRHGQRVYGDDFLERINVAIREQRGVDYRYVRTAVLRPSEDIGRMAAECYRRTGAASFGALPSIVARLAMRGMPEDEADLLSYLYFDACFTRPLVELGRADAEAHADEILEVLSS
ncbi:MAG: hypothetical protein D6815_08835 [Candidatus Dadabacteria bacterium]|nr:MAG: hypothetical protein D6815_08835 [Candidatus Dadabacteria bacterium]